MITFKGSPLTLQGPPLRVGDTMPGFTLTDTALTEVRDTDLCGIRVFLTVPSLDTGVCDQEVRWFNEKAAELPGVTIVAVSLDLPFAQARWCGGGGIEAVRTLSDYKERRFGKATGTYIEELALLARAVFVVDENDTVVYAEVVPEVSNHPKSSGNSPDKSLGSTPPPGPFRGVGLGCARYRKSPPHKRGGPGCDADYSATTFTFFARSLLLFLGSGSVSNVTFWPSARVL